MPSSPRRGGQLFPRECLGGRTRRCRALDRPARGAPAPPCSSAESAQSSRPCRCHRASGWRRGRRWPMPASSSRQGSVLGRSLALRCRPGESQSEGAAAERCRASSQPAGWRCRCGPPQVRRRRCGRELSLQLPANLCAVASTRPGRGAASRARRGSALVDRS